MDSRRSAASTEPDTGSRDEIELALAFQRGEKGAYQVIYDRYASRVAGVCRRMLVQPDDAQEAVQETFLRVYQALDRFNGRYHLGAWITRIATNVCLDRLRERGRKTPGELPLDLVAMDGGPNSEDDEPEAIVIRKAESRRVRKILASLPPLHRAAIVLRDFEGLSYEEIAQTLGITEPRVKALLHRARKGFRRTWASPTALGLVPLRLWQRLRGLASSSGQSAAVAASSPTIATCGPILQQCGAVMAEKVAPLITAALVGGAAVAAVVVPSGPAAQPTIVMSGAAEVLGEAQVPRENARARPPVPVPAVAPPYNVAPASNDEVEPAPAPTASPTPSPATTSSPEENADSGGSSPEGSGTAPKPQPSLTSESAPTGFQPAIGFDRGLAIPGAPATMNELRLDCDLPAVEHRVGTTIDDGDASYPGSLTVVAGPNGRRIELRLWKGSKEYVYSSWGAQPSVSWGRAGDELRLEMSGAFGPTYGYRPEEAQLPKSGFFQATLTLDCTRSVVILESVTFIAE